MSLDRFLLRMPKVELHVHLEGSMRPAVLLELARRNGIDLPAKDEAGLKRWFRFTDFEHFSTFKPQALHEKSLKSMLDQLLAWSGALKSIRTR